MKALFNTLLYQPLFNALVLLYIYLPGRDLGVAIVVLTLVIRVILWPLSRSAIAAQKRLQELQPKIDELKKEYKDKPQEQARAMMTLYKEHKINPAGSCLPLLIQLPVFLALYWVLGAGIHSQDLNMLYPFVSNPGAINSVAFGFLDLAKPSVVIAILAGAAQYWQGAQLVTKKPQVQGQQSKDESFTAIMNTQMKYMLPVITIVVGIKLPAGLTLYWLLSTLLYAVQQFVILRKGAPQSQA